MEKIAIISDVHGNMVALDTIFKDIESKNITRIFMLGDLIAKGSMPKQALEAIKEKCEVVLMGNCDELVANKKFETEEHIWNAKEIGEENVRYLKTLPFSYEFYMSGLKVRLYHASPNLLNDSIGYFTMSDKMESEMNDMFKNSPKINSINDELPDIVIFGHIHVPLIYRLGTKTLINPGSISNSCEIVHDARIASYMILEGEYGSHSVENISYKIIKVPYDYKKEIESLKKIDMPNKEMAINELNTGIYVKR